MLNNIGFEWSISLSWDDRYEELVSYAKVFGDTCVPSIFNDNPALGLWVSRQRTGYHKFQKGDASCGTTTIQIQRLNKIGFEWRIKGTRRCSSRDDLYKDLTSDARTFCDARVPQQFANTDLMDASVTRKEEIMAINQNINTVCGKTKVFEFSC